MDCRLREFLVKPRQSLVAVAIVCGLAVVSLHAQDSPGEAARRTNLDQVLDLYVRDGLVYYRALKADRRRLDGYVSGLASASIASASRDEQVAFWLNAYNAIVLKTIVDHYPIGRRSNEYPAGSIRQIPGAFERLSHQIAGKAMTLDQIEQTTLAAFNDPRVFMALGRGANGSGRLRSEAYAPDLLERQLAEAAAECTNHAHCVNVDPANGRMQVSSIFSWRSKEFSEAYAEKAPAVFASRSPMERAVLALVEPRLTSIEKEFLSKNQFKVEFVPFDWSLNDLTGRGGR
jgi:Protein of unknown function, DUF547